MRMHLESSESSAHRRINHRGVDNAIGSVIFFPHSDTHVQWMIPIAKGLNPSIFVTFPKLKSENAEIRLEENGVSYYEYSPSLLYQLKPKVLIFGNDWSNPELFQQAKEMKIPTVVIQEGVLDFISPESNRMKVANYAFIQGKIMKKYLKRPRIVTTGNPKYDFLYELPLPEQNVIMVNCNFTYGIFIKARESWLDDVVDVLHEMRIEFFVSKHPRDPGGFKKGIEVINSNALIVNEQLSRCSIVITRFSTIVYEAVIAGRQVIYYNPHKEDFGLLSSDETGTIIYANNQQELKIAITEAINRKNSNFFIDCKNSFLIDHIGKLDHSATKRCQLEIINIIEQYKSPNRYRFNLLIDAIWNIFGRKIRLNNIKKRFWEKIDRFLKRN